MAQHDMILDNAEGLAFRADTNNALAALISNSSGATEPATMTAYMWWADTSSGWLKQRNAANNAWINKLKLADATSTVGAALISAASATAAQQAMDVEVGVDVQAYDEDIPTVAASQAEMEAGTETALRSMSPLRIAQAIAALATTSESVPVRQTVLSGPVDSNGFAAFGGSTGSTTVTASGTLKATAAAGGDANYTGSIVNPSWTGLSTNGTMFLYLDITSSGVVTTGRTTLEPTYQWGGTYSTTNNQNTFNIQEMAMKAGNGSTASQVYRVFVGEVTVAGSVVTAITWYALMGRYYAEQTGLATASQYVKNHNIGTKFVDHIGWLECTTANNNFSVGDRVPLASPGDKGSGAATAYYTGVKGTRMTIAAYTGAGGIGLSDYTTGACNVPFTASSWKIVFAPRRSF